MREIPDRRKTYAHSLLVFLPPAQNTAGAWHHVPCPWPLVTPSVIPAHAGIQGGLPGQGLPAVCLALGLWSPPSVIPAHAGIQGGPGAGFDQRTQTRKDGIERVF